MPLRNRRPVVVMLTCAPWSGYIIGGLGLHDRHGCRDGEGLRRPRHCVHGDARSCAGGLVDRALHRPRLIYAPTALAIYSLLPAPFSDTDAFGAEHRRGDSGHGTQHLRPAFFREHNNNDIVYGGLIGASLKPALVPADDAIPTATAGRVLRGAFVPSDDVVSFNFTTTRFAQPASCPTSRQCRRRM